MRPNFDLKRQYGRGPPPEPPGTPRNPLNPTRNPAEPPRNPRGTPFWNPTRPTPLGACGAPCCLRRVGGGGWRGGYSGGWAFADFPLLVIVYPCCRQPPCALQRASPCGKALPGRQRAGSMRQRMHSVKGCKDATTKFRRKTPSPPSFKKCTLFLSGADTLTRGGQP